MSNTKDGGPAFPNTVRIDNEEFASLRGMSLRDYFAAEAMAACLPYRRKQFETDNEDQEDWDCFIKIAAQEAYSVADAMLQAREA